MYEPRGNARRALDPLVQFVDASPPVRLRGVVHRWLSLRTSVPLEHDYRFHALPDACTYLIFDQDDPRICGVTRLQTRSEEFTLGRDFHFTNVRLMPGAWTGEANTGLIDSPYTGDLPLLEFAERLRGVAFADQIPTLIELIEHLVQDGFLAPHPIIGRIFARVDEIHSVSEMASVACLSPRQLQRVLRRTVGLAPHDFLKVIRLQSTLRDGDPKFYSDQSHLIRTFRSATGYTPGEFVRRYEV